jgi:hypothetical protein
MIPSDSITNSSPVSLIAQSATIRPGSGAPGLHVTGSDVYIRGLQIFGGPNTQIGLVVDGAATLRLDGADIESMQQGGLLVTGGASYDVVNSIFANNGGARDSQNRQIGGVWVDLPTAGATARFGFNTVVNNGETGVVCSDPSQILDATLLAKNLGGGTTPDYSGCTLATTSKALGTADPMLTSTFRATATSPCVDFVATPPPGAPDHDIDEISRPQGKAFDCGASEYKAQ